MDILETGTSGEIVDYYQTKLNVVGFYTGEIDGEFGPATERAVRAFQEHYSLDVDGKIGEITASVLDIGLGIDKSLTLDDNDDYYNSVSEKQTLAIHHTSGWTTTPEGGPNTNFFHGWDTDGSRVSTHFSIDVFGQIYQHFPLKNWAHHLGVKPYRVNERMAKASYSVELSNEGEVRKDSKGRWKFWAGQINRTLSPVKKTWRGGQYWANYTDVQLEALEDLIMYLHIAFGLEINPADTHLEYAPSIIKNPNFKGIYSHSNVRKDKTDLSPAFEWGEFFDGLKSRLSGFSCRLGTDGWINIDSKSVDMTLEEAFDKISDMSDREALRFLEGDSRKTAKSKVAKIKERLK